MSTWTLLLIVLFVCCAGLLAWTIRLSLLNRRLEQLLSHKIESLERLQTHFGRFTPEEVIEHLSQSDGHYAAELRTVTVLFADLQGFTRMCQDMDPQTVVTILNGYFRAMSDALSSHHGQVTELIGDGILSLFGALRPNPWQVQDAVRGALAMRQALAEYNRQLRAQSLPELSFGIGIHQGEVLAGVMGNRELSKFGVVGDPINVASRIEALTRVHDCDILVSEQIRDVLGDQFVLKPMPAIDVKGKTDPIVTYSVERVRAG